MLPRAAALPVAFASSSSLLLPAAAFRRACTACHFLLPRRRAHALLHRVHAAVLVLYHCGLRRSPPHTPHYFRALVRARHSLRWFMVRLSAAAMPPYHTPSRAAICASFTHAIPLAYLHNVCIFAHSSPFCRLRCLYLRAARFFYATYNYHYARCCRCAHLLRACMYLCAACWFAYARLLRCARARTLVRRRRAPSATCCGA